MPTRLCRSQVPRSAEKSIEAACVANFITASLQHRLNRSHAANIAFSRYRSSFRCAAGGGIVSSRFSSGKKRMSTSTSSPLATPRCAAGGGVIGGGTSSQAGDTSEVGLQQVKPELQLSSSTPMVTEPRFALPTLSVLSAC